MADVTGLYNFFRAFSKQGRREKAQAEADEIMKHFTKHVGYDPVRQSTAGFPPGYTAAAVANPATGGTMWVLRCDHREVAVENGTSEKAYLKLRDLAWSIETDGVR